MIVYFPKEIKRLQNEPPKPHRDWDQVKNNYDQRKKRHDISSMEEI